MTEFWCRIQLVQQTKKITVTGKVQGVYFRQSTAAQAMQLGLTGTVRNKADGESVEIIATGNEGALKQLIAWCKTGPSRAHVQKAETIGMPLTHFPSFVIIR